MRAEARASGWLPVSLARRTREGTRTAERARVTPGGFSPPRLPVEKLEERRLSGEALLALAEAALSRGVSFRFCARGSSMTPFIRDGDVITVAPLGPGLPGLGEVVAFAHPVSKKLVVHRVVGRPRAVDAASGAGDGVPGEAVLIRGDWVARGCDGLVPRENLLGTVVQVERGGHPVRLGLGPERRVIAWLSRPRLLMPLGRLARRCAAPLRWR